MHEHTSSLERAGFAGSFSEYLTLNFYLWERRGRGWDLYEKPLSLEPPFVPFSHTHAKYLQPPLQDDGHKPTFLSRLTDGLASQFSTQQLSQASSYEQQIKALSYYFPAPHYVDEEPDLTTLKMLIPADLDMPFGSMYQVLLNIQSCRYPLAFELVGNQTEVSIQWTCRISDMPILLSQLQAYYPAVVFEEAPDTLVTLFYQPIPTLVVDCGLSEEFMRPIHTWKDLKTDPFIGILGAMQQFREDEGGVIQILFQPAQAPWAGHMMRAVTDAKGKPFFLDSPEMPTLAKEKASHPLFGVVVRVAGYSPDHQRTTAITSSLIATLNPYGRPGSNALAILSNEGYPHFDHLLDFSERQSRRTGMLLNAAELVSLVHLPSKMVKSPKLTRISRRTKAPPPIALRHPFVVGKNYHLGKKQAVSISTRHRLQHCHLIGATGTGKSTLLLNMMIQDMEQGSGFALFDPHGELVESLLCHVPEDRIKDVIVFDPADADFPVGFNILSAHSEIEKQVLSSDLTALFKKFATSFGDQMISVLGNSLAAFLESEQGGTLLDLRRFLGDKEFRYEFLQSIHDPEVVYYWEKEFPMLRGRAESSIVTRLDSFLRPKLIRNIVSQKKGLDFSDILNSQKIFLAKLSHGLIGEENSFLLGSLLVSKLQQAVMARQAISKEARIPFYCYIDEFHHFITPSLSSILSGARKYGLGLILAHQGLQQLWSRDIEVAHSVIANPGIRICFRVGDFDAPKLASGFSSFDEQDLKNLSRGEAILRIERAEFDCNITTFSPPTVTPEEAEARTNQVMAFTRQTYATPRADLEAAYMATYAKSSKPKQTVAADLLAQRTHLPEDEPTIPQAPLGLSEPDPFTELVELYTKSVESYTSEQHEQSEPGEVHRNQESTPSDLLDVAEVQRSHVTEPEPRPEELEDIFKEAVEEEIPVVQEKQPTEHRYLQELIQTIGQDQGYKAVVEQQTQDGGRVDVSLEKDEIKLAVEISFTTPSEYELHNIQKCLFAGYTQVVMCASEQKKLNELKRFINKALSPSEKAKVHFLTPNKLIRFLQEQANPPEPTVIKGYRVKMMFPGANQPMSSVEEKGIAQVINEAYKRQKEGT